MTEKEKIGNAESQAENTEVLSTATEPQKEPLITVKFNKKIIKLGATQAAELAQKGMKFEAIANDYETLKALANKNGKSVAQFLESIKEERLLKRKTELLEKCGGDSALAEHILALEEGQQAVDTANFDELSKKFPEIKSAEQLPEEVLQNAQLSGRALLDEYLRYLLDEKLRVKETAKHQAAAESLSLGSQASCEGVVNPETAEFLRGLWK